METPLLLNDDEGADYLSVKTLKSAFREETIKIWTIAGPIIFQIVCMYGTNSVTNIFVGHIGELELSAVAISISVIATFAYGFMYGMGSAAETLCGQAFGAGQVHMLGVYMQRSCIVMFGCCLLILPVYIFSTPILLALGQQEDVADLAGQFTILIIPQLFSFALSFPTQKFLQAQSAVSVIAWISFVTLVLHVLMLWVIIYVLDWGMLGAAIAVNVTGWITAIAQVIYATYWFEDSWRGLSWLAFKDLWSFIKLSIASAIMLCLEVWYMMSIIILTGHLNNSVIALDAISVCLNMNGWENIIFIGMNAAISVRVGNELGKGRPRAAKYAVYITLCQCFVLGLIFMLVLLGVRNYFAVIFTSSQVVQHYASKLAYLLAITMLLNSVQPVISGVAVGGGWQALVAYINLGSYYVFGLPFGLLLGYKLNFGVMGLWGGMICGTILQTMMLLLVLYKTNWNKEVADTSERIRKLGDANLIN